ncbi:uncharacterized protein [Haliotis cracherodii]|uniref:uncharacterized protein n=1 Tax=Haliotis cracherodii TaxID=6455 RepID=UPI0039ED1BA1
MAAEEPLSYLHGPCQRMAENLLKDVAGLTDKGKGPDEDLVLQVVDVLQARIETVQEYLKAHVKTKENVADIKQSFHKLKENETACLQRILNTKETARFPNTTHIEEIRDKWPLIRDIPLKNTHLINRMYEEHLISEDSEKSLREKSSDIEKSLAFAHYLIGLSMSDYWDKFIPILKETEEETGLSFQLRFERPGSDHQLKGPTLSKSTIVELIHPQRLAQSLYETKGITEVIFKDLTSKNVSESEKRTLLKNVDDQCFMDALQDKYKHLHDILRVASNTYVKSSTDGERHEDQDMSTTSSDDAHSLDRPVDSNAHGNIGGSPNPEAAPSWCKCGHCRDMKPEDEKVCCDLKEGDCLSKSKTLLVLLHGPKSFRSFFKDKFRRSDMARVNKRSRHVIYRQMSLLQHGTTGPRKREPLPSCVVWRVRKEYPRSTRILHWF